MGWFKVDDSFFENPKVEMAGDDAAHLHLRGIAYCSRNQTDGKIPITTVPKLWFGRDDLDDLVDALIDAGLWKKRERHYEIHDYLEHQSSRAQIRAKQKGARDRKRKSRASHSVTSRDGHRNVTAPEAETDVDTDIDVEADRLSTGLEDSSIKASALQAVETQSPPVRKHPDHRNKDLEPLAGEFSAIVRGLVDAA